MRFINKPKSVESVIQEVSAEENTNELEEQVADDKEYDAEAAANVVIKELNATDEDFDFIQETFINAGVDPQNLTAVEVENAIREISQHYNLPENYVITINDKISALKSPKEIRIDDQKQEIKDDYDTIHMMISDNKFLNSYTYDLLYETMQKLQNKIQELEKPEENTSNV